MVIFLCVFWCEAVRMLKSGVLATPKKYSEAAITEGVLLPAGERSSLLRILHVRLSVVAGMTPIKVFLHDNNRRQGVIEVVAGAILDLM